MTYTIERPANGPHGPSYQEKSFGEIVDSTEGANIMRLVLLIPCLIAYFWSGAHRAQAWECCRYFIGWNVMPIIILSGFFPPLIAIFGLELLIVRGAVYLLDSVLFAIPRWLFRRCLGPNGAFWFAFLFQILSLCAGAAYLRRFVVANTKREIPVHFGPAVLKRLGISSQPVLKYNYDHGRIRPLISSRDSLAQHSRSQERAKEHSEKP